MNRRIAAVLTISLVALLLASLLIACGSAQEESAVPTAEQEQAGPSTLDGQSLVRERCTRCHDLRRVEQAKKTEEEWKATVERMVEKGATLNQAEQELVVKYLTETFPQ